MGIACRARTQGMPLTRAIERYTPREDGIDFLMRDGPTEVVCEITLQASGAFRRRMDRANGKPSRCRESWRGLTLSQFGRTICLTEPTKIFETGRDAIERAASDKYDRTARVPYEVLTVTIEDLDADASRGGPDLLGESGLGGEEVGTMLTGERATAT
jgi:hypothetical protein